MAEKRVKAVLEIGGAVAGSLKSSFALVTGNTKKLGGEVKALNARAKELRSELKKGVGGPEAERELAKLEARIRSTKRGMESLHTLKGLNIGDKIGSVGTNLARGFAISTAAAAGLGFAVYKLAEGVGKYADDSAEAAGALSMQTNALIKYKYAADDVGTGAENLSNSLGKMQLTLEKARGGKGGEVFKLLRLDVQKLSRQKPEEQIEAIADAFSKYNGKVSKTAIAQAIFGKSGKQMVNFLNLGKAGLKEYGDEAERLGLTIDEDLVKTGDEFGRQQLRLGSTLLGVRNIMGRELLPVVNDLMDQFSEFVRGNAGELRAWAKETAAFLKANLPGMISDLRSLGETFVGAGRSVVQFLEPIGGAKAALVGLAAVPFIPAAASIASLGLAFIQAAPAVWGMATAIGAFVVASAPVILTVGLITAGVIALGAAIYEVWKNWDTYVYAFNQAKDAIVAGWQALTKAAYDFGFALGSAVKGAFLELKAVAQEWFDWLAAKFKAVSDTIGQIFSGERTFRVNPGGAAAATGASLAGQAISGNADAKAAPPAIAGERADGGPVAAGKSYLVGERGPEIFSPRTSGQIIPNAGGSKTDARTYNITINAAPGMDERSLADLVLARLDGRQAALAGGALFD